MKIGLIVFSQTGHTMSVVDKLKDRLMGAGHQVQIDPIAIQGDAAPGKFELTHQPETDPYDGIVFASPVQAFSLNPVMKHYLEGLSSLKGKSVAFLVTKQLSSHWTGGNRAVSMMKTACLAKEADILGSGIVVWKETKRAVTEEEALNHLAQLSPGN